MKITVYYVVRDNKDNTFRLDSGPYSSYNEALEANRASHYYSSDRYSIFESSIEGKVL